jgi:hypothetical protein
LGDERHGMIMDSATHAYLHNTGGSTYIDGLQLGNFDIGAGDTFSVSNGSFYDEDIKHIIEDGLPQDLSTTAYIPVLYRDGNPAMWKTAPITQAPIIKIAAANRAAYNKLDGSV